MVTKEGIVSILGKVIALFKKTDAKQIKSFRNNLWKGVRFVDCLQNNFIFMQPVVKKSSNFVDFQHIYGTNEKKSHFERFGHKKIPYFKNKSQKDKSYADFCQNNLLKIKFNNIF